MKKTLLSILSIMLIGSVSQRAFAQDTDEAGHNVGFVIPEVALLDLERTGGVDISLSPDSPTEAGDPLDFSSITNDEVWLNYSSIVGTSIVDLLPVSTSRKVTVRASAALATFPADLKVTAGLCTTGDGTRGVPVVGGVTLTLVDQNLITGIGSAYTGDGVDNGHQLTYTATQKTGSTYAALRYGTETVTVTYTLSDDTIL